MFQDVNETPNQGEIVGARLSVWIVRIVVEVVRRGGRLLEQRWGGEDKAARTPSQCGFVATQPSPFIFSPWGPIVIWFRWLRSEFISKHCFSGLLTTVSICAKGVNSHGYSLISPGALAYFEELLAKWVFKKARCLRHAFSTTLIGQLSAQTDWSNC
jgi:hypothetical protein